VGDLSYEMVLFFLPPMRMTSLGCSVVPSIICSVDLSSLRVFRVGLWCDFFFYVRFYSLWPPLVFFCFVFVGFLVFGLIPLVFTS